MIKNISKLFLIASLVFLSGCETFDLDQNENPSVVSQSQSDPTFVFNYVQLQLPDFVNSMNSFTQRVIRQYAMTGGNTYNNAFKPENFDTNWTQGYLILNAIKSLEPQATASGQNYILGASKIIRCYILMTLVDNYGDIPYSEALQGNDNQTPKYDNSAAVYAGVYNELNQAISFMNASITDSENQTLLPRDLYYGKTDDNGGDAARWIALANTLKLRMCNNAKAVGTIGPFTVATEIASLLAEDLIDTPEEDFAFKYGTERDLPNSRHPVYNDQYEFGGGAYIANYFFWTVQREKGKGDAAEFDPREHYYFFRTATISSTVANSQTLPCRDLTKPSHYNNDQYASFYDLNIKAPYCTSISNTINSSSYIGRDHGDNSGIPQDSDFRTVAGLYPAGGAVGPPSNVNGPSTFGTKGALGQGIMPIMLSSFVSFIKAEIYMYENDPASAKVAMLDGIRKSIIKTTTFLPHQPSDLYTQQTIDTKTTNYVNFIGSTFDGLNGNTQKQLELIIKEAFIAEWGNGIEPYNAYRRTGYPSNLQPTLEEEPGDYFYTALYAAASVNNNPNAPANVRTKKAFWQPSIQLH